jgi:DNA polymerase-3 subunit alpha
MMAFATIEDPQGVIELVVFPNTWERFSGLMEVEKLIVVEGKLDSQNGETKILVDKIDNKLNIVVPLELDGAALVVSAAITPTPAATAPAAKGAWQPSPALPEDFSLDDLPEPPDAFAPDWEKTVGDYVPSKVAAGPDLERTEEARPDPEVVSPHPDLPKSLDPQDLPAFIEPAPAFASKPQSAADETEAPVPAAQMPTAFAQHVTGLGSVVSPAPKVATDLPLMPPRPAARGGGEQAPRMVTVYLRSKGDKARDILVIRRVHGALISYPGGDRFAFYVFEGRNGYLLDFPNDSTDLTEELVARLEDMVGENNYRVEPITLQ